MCQPGGRYASRPVQPQKEDTRMYQANIDALIAGWNQGDFDAMDMMGQLGLVLDPSA